MQETHGKRVYQWDCMPQKPKWWKESYTSFHFNL